MSDQKRAVVLGGAGFLGSHLIDLLINEGWKVLVVDNLITGNLDNLAHLSNNDALDFMEHDISQHIDIAGDVDMIYNLASPASPIDYLELPIQTLKVGALGTHNALNDL